MDVQHVLSKSRIKRGLQCEKALYLTLFHKELEAKVSPSTQFLFDEGNEVGEIARKQFPGGVLINNAPWDRTGAAAATKKAIKSGATVIFEASFLASGLYCRVDVLKHESNTSPWEVIEVKSTTKVKKAHVEDLAIQAAVLSKAHIKVKSYHLMHLNPDHLFPSLNPLFVIEDTTDRVKDHDLTSRIAGLQKTITIGKQPKVAVGPQCDLNSYPCPFRDHCFKDFPNPSVFDLPGIGPHRGWTLVKTGKVRIEHLNPLDFPAQTQQAIRSTKSGKRWVNAAGIKKAISQWGFPLYFLDFETLAPAIPRFDGCSPYKAVPFQFSCDVWESPKKKRLRHFEYLHLENSDPREAIAKALVNGFGAKGAVLSYYASVEKGIIRDLAAESEKRILTELAESVPKYAEKLLDIAVCICGSFYGVQEQRIRP